MKNGFTLVELSIVLVIIGLLIGGILVGQSLIESAQNHRMVKQIQQTKIAYDQFKERFKYPPGDVSNNILPTTYDGDQNNKIDNSEDLQVWSQLVMAGMYPDTDLVSNFNGETIMLSSIDNAGIIITYGSSHMFKFGNILAIRDTEATQSGGLYAQQVYYLDKKMDDSQPKTGAIHGHSFGDGSSSGCTSGNSGSGDYAHAWMRSPDSTGVFYYRDLNSYPDATYNMEHETRTCSPWFFIDEN